MHAPGKSLDVGGQIFHEYAFPFLSVAVSRLVTGVVQRRVFVQGEERRVEQHSVVVLHDDPLVLCLDPWFVLIG